MGLPYTLARQTGGTWEPVATFADFDLMMASIENSELLQMRLEYRGQVIIEFARLSTTATWDQLVDLVSDLVGDAILGDDA